MLPVPVYSGKTAGKRHLQVPRSRRAGRCSASLSVENKRPEPGTHRLPAGMGRGRGGTEERSGLGEKLPSRAHFWSSLYSYRPILPSQPSFCGGRNFSAPKMNVTRVLGSCLGAWGSCLGSGAAGPARPGWDTPAPPNPRTFPGREIALPWEMFGRGAGTRTGPSRDGTHGPRKPSRGGMRGAAPLEQTGGAVPSSPTSPGHFRLQTNSRGDSAELQDPCTFCPPRGPICFPPAKSPQSGAACAALAVPLWARGTGGASIWASPWPGINESVLGPV